MVSDPLQGSSDQVAPGWLNFCRGDNDYPVNMWKKAILMELTSIIILESHQPGLFFHAVLKFNLLQQAAGFGAQYDESDWKIGFSPVPRE